MGEGRGRKEEHNRHREHNDREVALAEHVSALVYHDGDGINVVGPQYHEDGDPRYENPNETEGKRDADPTAEGHLHVEL